MNKIQTRRTSRFLIGLLTVILSVFHGFFAYAQTFDTLDAGTYSVDASLSCYINAMGGVEFGAPMLKSTKLTVAEDGTKTIKMNLGKSVVNIYSVTCDTFVDPKPAGAAAEGSVTCGTIGYYNEAGVLVTDGVSYTMSSDTAANSKQEQVHYVDSITFPIDKESSTYTLSLYVNSNVMGTQFSNEKYPAKLTVNWSSVYEQAGAKEADQPGTVKAETEPAKIETVKEETEPAKIETAKAETEPAVEQDTMAEKEETVEKQETEEEKAAELPEKETMEGLNIYRAEEEETLYESAANREIVSMDKADGYIAYFDRTVLAVAATVAVMLIVIGLVLMIVGGREEKKSETNVKTKTEN
ncbi:MAG: hypothetical protein ACI39W_06130 [Brotaphodocola sp.]